MVASACPRCILFPILEMKKIKLKSLSGIVKTLGITLFLPDVMTITFYEGLSLTLSNHLQLGHGLKGSAQHQ
ncbi:hypothetical protein Taro_043937 [Colocasia esculenta]|uniref:Uncharacterized protein n=1 Tax=Colocasia esculenta TaxID=4460 RepID=A0A843WZU4_COLES|nr:hypothetical protein [Colocasia esculenta]